MSVRGRNTVRGVLLDVYRPTATRDDGGTVTRTWGTPVATGLRIELSTIQLEIARRVFGTEDRIDLSCVLSRDDYSLQLEDGILVHTGRHAGERFVIIAGRPLGPYNEWGLQHTTQPFTP